MKDEQRTGSYKRGLIRSCASIVSIIAFALVAPQGHCATVDSFDTPAAGQTISIPFPGGVTDTNNAVATTAYGGARGLSLTAGIWTSEGDIATAIVTDASANEFTASIPANSNGSGKIVWNGSSTDQGACLDAPGPNLLTDANQFIIDYQSDHTMTPKLRVYRSTGDCADFREWEFDFAGDDLPHEASVLFNTVADYQDFLDDVGRIEFIWTRDSAIDFIVKDIRTDCPVVKPTVTLLRINNSGSPGGTVNLQPPCDETKNIEICFTVANPTASVTVRNQNTSAIVYGPKVPDSGGHDCFSTSISTYPTSFFVDAVEDCSDANATITAICTDQPSRVPSLNEWGMILLALILAVTALWQLRRRRIG